MRDLLAQANDQAAQRALELREGDHRIKNCLQVVASMLELQARSADHPTTPPPLRAAAGRIRAASRVHDAVQINGGGSASVDLGALVTSLCTALHAMGGDAASVRITVDAISIKVPPTFAQPALMIVNELVLNALRHGFPEGQAGTIFVGVARDDRKIRITVDDSGCGLPNEIARENGFGTTLVRALVTKLDATLEVRTSSQGAGYTLLAPWPNEPSPVRATHECTAAQAEACA